MKIYFINIAIAKMILFVKTSKGKTHIKYWSRNTAYCGKPIEGEIIKEAAEDQLCAKCLHSMLTMNREGYSCREETQSQEPNAKRVRKADYTLAQAEAMRNLFSKSWNNHWQHCEQCVQKDLYQTYQDGTPLQYCEQGQTLRENYVKWKRRVKYAEEREKKERRA